MQQSFRQYEHVSMYLQSKITDKNIPLYLWHSTGQKRRRRQFVS